MPWASQLDNYYNSFGNGYVPYFVVIGADYEYLSGGNNVSTAINAANNAMLNMENITVAEPISNVFINANSSTTINIANTFQHSQGAAMTYTISDNTNPDCCLAYITGNVVHLDAQTTAGITNITVTATAGGITGEDTFMVTVSDILPVPVNPTGEVVYPEVQLSWEEAQASLPVTGWNIYRDGEQIASVPGSHLYYNDQPADGSYIYTITAQYPQVESDFSFPVEIAIYNIIGDVDGSLAIDSYDASMVLHYVSGVEPASLAFPWAAWRLQRADVDGNELIEAYDCSLILQFIVRMIDEF
jgi:hypothetical protein